MSLSSAMPKRQFQNFVQGTFGKFSTPAGQVNYILTKARLGGEATDPERRLTQHLAPVREVLPAEELDFNQLLQRDLDDHRVAVQLLQYLLIPEKTGPAFFPPVVAIALPFKDHKPGRFPLLEAAARVSDDGLIWSQQDAGEFLRVRRLLTEEGTPSPIPLGRLHWNSEFCRLLVVDGQHRAMALLAIERTIRGSWEGSGGERYRYFYESRVHELLKDSEVDLADIELPVATLWFPDMFGADHEPHVAARKLFVDVNKEARRPSESRLILLSDTELVNVFTRTTLTELRNNKRSEMLPLYCVEYDNPDTNTTQSARWSALTNIHILKQIVNRVVFGPPKYILDLNAPIGKREPQAEKDSHMRVLLDVETMFDPTIQGDEPFKRDDLGNGNFPEAAVPLLAAKYRDTWSAGILTLLSQIRWYEAHADALTSLKENWHAGDSVAQLARDALFNGVGMYWTLRDSAVYYRESLPPGKKNAKGHVRPDIVKAWDMLVDKQEEFESLRAEALVGDPNKPIEVNQIYQALNTHACQLGLGLTLASVYEKAKFDEVDVVELSNAMVHGVNAWIEGKASGEYDRRFALARVKDSWPKNSINSIANMDAPRGVQFRYFWLEILCSDEAAPAVSHAASAIALQSMRDIARAGYIIYLAGERSKALKVAEPHLNDIARTDKANLQARADVRRALMKWFGMSAASWDTWVESDITAKDFGDAAAADSEAEAEAMDDEGEGISQIDRLEDLLGDD